MSCDLCEKEIEELGKKESDIPEEVTCLTCGTVWIMTNSVFFPVSPVDHLEIQEIKRESPSHLS